MQIKNMEQLNFLSGLGEQKPIINDLFEYYPGVFSDKDSISLMRTLIDKVQWTQKSVLMYGKEVLTPRLTAWFGDDDVDYSANGSRSRPYPWIAELLTIRDKVEKLSGMKFNSVLLNYYRDGNDSVSWHSDSDGIAGRNMFVASISFGQERVFDIRSIADHQHKFSILLESGSCFLMKGEFQEKWQHRIAKSKTATKERLNLTFRISSP
jgi:alkylated DNA repair dioxygenase AlkB